MSDLGQEKHYDANCHRQAKTATFCGSLREGNFVLLLMCSVLRSWYLRISLLEYHASPTDTPEMNNIKKNPRIACCPRHVL